MVVGDDGEEDYDGSPKSWWRQIKKKKKKAKMMKGHKKIYLFIKLLLLFKNNDLSLYDCVPKDLTTQIK